MRRSLIMWLIAGAAAMLVPVAAGRHGVVPVPWSFGYIALGDSYSSGEGIDPYFRDEVDPVTKKGSLDNRCHRSTRAYAEWILVPGTQELAYSVASGGGDPGTRRGTNKYGSDEKVRRRGGVRWALWACSGAVTKNVLPSSQGGLAQNDPKEGFRDAFPQLSIPSVKNAKPDLVTVTIGGNDAGFTDVVTNCAIRKHCNTSALRSNVEITIRALSPRLVKTFRAIKEVSRTKRLLVLDYPQIFPPNKEERNCPELKPWSEGEQVMIRNLGVRLNRAIKDAAAMADAAFISVGSRFAGHEVCGLEGSWLHGPSAALTRRPPLVTTDDESFHPTVVGQRSGYADAVNDFMVPRVPTNPSANRPRAWPSECFTEPLGATCQNSAIAALNAARAAAGQKSYGLPPTFLSLPPSVQLFILVGLDRAVYGLRPVAGLNTELDSVSSAAARAGVDPEPSIEIDWRSNVDRGAPNVLYAYYSWVYDDGPGPNAYNRACQGAVTWGCWKHREAMFAFGSSQTVSMGAATEKTSAGRPSHTMIIADTAGGETYRYTWAQALAAGTSRSG